jgi:glycopeptide antibiotics resistance protein
MNPTNGRGIKDRFVSDTIGPEVYRSTPGPPVRERSRPDATAASPPRRGHFAVLAVLYAALAVYGSLVPLQFRMVPLAEAWNRFQSLPYLTLGIESRSDWVANILLFIPLGFLLMAASRADRPGRLRALVAALVTVAVCAGLSLAIEFTQIWFPPRTVSQNDIVAEVLGAVAGVGVWGLTGQRLTAFARDYASTLSPRRSIDLVLEGYLAGFLLYSVLPLDLTISPADLWRKYRDGKILVFGLGGGGPLELTISILAKVAPFVPVGLLISSLLGARRSRIGDLGRGLARGGLLALGIEAAQLIVYSRYTNGADVLWGALGVALGVGLWSNQTSRPTVQQLPVGPGCSWAWLGLTAAYAAVLIIIFWMPFRFVIDRDVLRSRIHELNRVPFAALYWGTDWNAMTQITSKVLWFAPLGALLARGIVIRATQVSGRRLRALACLLACLALATTIELGQVFLPDHFADLTDVLLYGTGAALGLMMTLRVLVPTT